MAASGGAGLTGAAAPMPKPPKPKATPYKPFTATPVRPQNVNKPATPGQAHPAPSTAGHWVPQGDSWVLIHAVGKNQWAQGALPPGTVAPPKPTKPTPIPSNPLAPWTNSQIQRQATKTVAASYGPGTADLNNQQQQAQNLYKAQTADDQYFAQWLAQNTQDLNTKVGTVNNQLAGVLSGLQASQAASLAAATPAVGGAQESAAGSGLAPGQATSALQQETAPGVDAANAHTASVAAEGVQNMLTQQQAAQNSGEVGQARVAATGTAQLGALNTTLNSIAAARTKQTASETSDIQKEIVRLQGVELSKRQWLRSEADLEQKTGVANQVALSGAAAKTSEAASAATNAATSQAKAAETARHNAAIEQIDSAHYTNAADLLKAQQKETARHNSVEEGIQQQNANTASSKVNAAAGTGVKFGTPVQQRTVKNYVDTVRQALQTDIQRYHKNDPQALSKAYHDIQSGRAAKQGIVIPRPPANANLASYLNAASNTLTSYGGGGLTPGDIAFLNGEGLQVGSTYARAGSSKLVAPVAASNAQVPGF